MHRRRKLVNVIACAVAGGHGLRRVLAGLDPVRDHRGWGRRPGLSVFTEMTPPPQAETGGLANAIFGSLMMVSLATLLGTPIGVLAGIYLAEYGQKTWLGSDHALHQRHPAVGAVDRDRPVHLRRWWWRLQGFSGIAGVLALALIVIPVVIRRPRTCSA
jgi:phosphate transport system permease protein